MRRREPDAEEQRALAWLAGGARSMDEVREVLGLACWCRLFNAGWAMVLNATPCITPQGERVLNRRKAA